MSHERHAPRPEVRGRRLDGQPVAGEPGGDRPGHITYIKALRSEDVARIFPQAPALQPGLDLFALLAADGTPILLTDSREAAVANAAEHDMVTVSVH